MFKPNVLCPTQRLEIYIRKNELKLLDSRKTVFEKCTCKILQFDIVMKQILFGNGKISRAEFLDLQPDHESLFNEADTNGDDHVDCEEFKAAVHIFGGEATCEQ